MLRSPGRSRSRQRHRHREREARQRRHRKRSSSPCEPQRAPRRAAAAAHRAPVTLLVERSRSRTRAGPATVNSIPAKSSLEALESPPMVPLPMYDENGWLRPGFQPPSPPPGSPPPWPSSPSSPRAKEEPAKEAALGAAAVAFRDAAPPGASAAVTSPAAAAAPAPAAVGPPRDLNGLTGAALARMGLIPRGGGPTGSTVHGFNSKGFPMRPGMPMCSYYTRTGNCAYGISCKWDHPERGAA
mmetsp:Transcript_223/g.495  ORF Transcript_223/g.495 Transcript_223/m.495 type:complete len:242 (+) Transcript_223:141-866(+)